jgi:hypothetical protein
MVTGGSFHAVKQLVHKMNHSHLLLRLRMSGAITLHLYPFIICAGSALPVYKRDELNQEWKYSVMLGQLNEKNNCVQHIN